MPQPRFLFEWGRQGQAPGEFRIPIDLAVNGQGEVIVTDFRNSRVQVFTTAGVLLDVFDVLPYAGGLALDAAGRIYLAHFPAFSLDDERQPDRITVYDRGGRYLREWGGRGNGPGQLDFPGGLAVAPDGRVYVADQTNHRIQVFGPDGEYRAQWGRYGSGAGQFGGSDIPESRTGGPNFVAIDSAGDVYVTEAMQGRIQKFTAEGEWLLSWGDLGTGPGGFGGTFTGFPGVPVRLQGPMGITVDRDGQVWVVAVSGRLQQFDREGRLRQALDLGQGTGPGQFLAPHGLALDGEGRLYVADSFNHRVQVFAAG